MMNINSGSGGPPSNDPAADAPTSQQPRTQQAQAPPETEDAPDTTALKTEADAMTASPSGDQVMGVEPQPFQPISSEGLEGETIVPPPVMQQIPGEPSDISMLSGVLPDGSVPPPPGGGDGNDQLISGFGNDVMNQDAPGGLAQTGDDTAQAAGHDTHEMEQVAFTYQRIETETPAPGALSDAEAPQASAGDLADWQANYGTSGATNPGPPDGDGPASATPEEPAYGGPDTAPQATHGGPMEGGPLASAGEWIASEPSEAIPDNLASSGPDSAPQAGDGSVMPSDLGAATDGNEEYPVQLENVMLSSYQFGGSGHGEPGGEAGSQDLMNQSETLPGDGSVLPADLMNQSETLPGDGSVLPADLMNQSEQNQGTNAPGEQEGIILQNQGPNALGGNEGIIIQDMPDPSAGGPNLMMTNRMMTNQGAQLPDDEDEMTTLGDLGVSEDVKELGAGPIIGAEGLADMDDDFDLPAI